MDYYSFELRPGSDADDIWDELTQAGYQLLYGTEDADGTAKIFGFMPTGITKPHSSITTITLQSFDEIDWQSQWIETAGGNHEGIIQLDLKNYQPGSRETLNIYPGPGFGDFNHPTTKQALRLMAPLAEGKCVLDIGCGSGILSLAAAKMGAFSVHGIDIDENAITHSRHNAIKNQLDSKVSFDSSADLSDLPIDQAPLVIAMNMISSEQTVAWNSLLLWHNMPADIITSGVLEEQRQAYLQLSKTWGWHLIHESSQDGWLAFHFKNR